MVLPDALTEAGRDALRAVDGRRDAVASSTGFPEPRAVPPEHVFGRLSAGSRTIAVMSDAETLGGTEKSSAEKDPSTWVTGGEPATGAQKSYIDTLARQAGEEISADLTKAEASEQIERLQEETGKGA